MPIKSTRQIFEPNSEQTYMMETFRQMVNDCIRIGLGNNCATLKKLSLLSYHKMKNYDIMSYYKLTAISYACGRLAQRKKDIKKGRNPKPPYIKKPFLVSCYGFKINGVLLSFPIRNREFANILLNDHTTKTISDKSIKVRSFTITPNSLSLSIQKEVEPFKPEKTIGIDRNLRNVTFGNSDKVILVNTAELLKIKENYNHVAASIRRDDWRVRKKIRSRLGIRQARRIQQRIHRISKSLVEYSKKQKAMIIFEDLNGIRRLYRKGNGQGRKFRRKLNSLPNYELERQVTYKADWEGVPAGHVNPRCTSMFCPRCGGKLQEDRQRRRDLWCGNCERWQDRDVIAAMNISHKGLVRLANSEGDTGEAMSGNLNPEKEPVILRVDVSKLITDLIS
ncbi:MAG: transposase [Candidatus Nitrosotenuis sp.]